MTDLEREVNRYLTARFIWSNPDDLPVNECEEEARELIAMISHAALTEAAEDAEKVARLDATPFNQATNAEHSYMRYHDLNKVREEDVRTVANWLHGRAALIGAPRVTTSQDVRPEGGGLQCGVST